ncbi:MAG: septal ring lytic transglycosylase RlpA family protein [Methylococcaceae bacterium]|nr:MAG: septal ring lytic transglycosylase RlpA family protein [Methylococcaceae bacterium]
MTNSLKLVAKSILSVSLLSACSVVSAKGAPHHSSTEALPQIGLATYYSDHYQGRRTASGERYDKTKLTATHSKLPFGTRLRVTNLANHKSVVVRITDRARARNGKLVDLSMQAARELDFVKAGRAKVKLEVLSLGS